MIKFIIGLIAVVFLVLAGYMFTQSNKIVEHKVAKKVETKVTTSHEVEKPKVSQSNVKEHFSAKVEKKDAMVITLDKSVEISDSVESSDEIGKDITQEDIDNAGSDEEKERMISLAAYRETSINQRKTALSEEDFLKILKNHFNNTTNKKD